MEIGGGEYLDPWMPWRVAETILPSDDKRNYDSWVRQGIVAIEAGEESKTGSGRGKARTYSLASCIALASVWELVRTGYKPSACKKIVDFMIKLGEKYVQIDEEAALYQENPIIGFYKMERFEPTELAAIQVDRRMLGAWVANPSSKEARPIAKQIERLTNTSSGNIPAYFIFEGGYVLRRIIEGYLEAREVYRK